MKSTTIYSKAVLIFLTLICLLNLPTVSGAQTSTTKKKSSQKVEINMDGNKVSLKMDDNVFDLDMVFDFDATEVIAAISEELGAPRKAGKFKLWKGDGYDIKVKNGNLDVFFNRNQVSKTYIRQMENIFADLFSDLELDIDISRYN